MDARESDSFPVSTQCFEPDRPSPEYSPSQPEELPGPVQEDAQRYSYCLKFFNPKKRSKFVVDKLRRYSRFKSPTELRECLQDEFKQLVSSRTNFDIGYNSGQRGSAKIWITDEEDLVKMYSTHNKPNQEIVLWCEGMGNATDETTATSSKGKKRHAVDDGDRPVSKRQQIQDAVEDIVMQLEEEHGSQFTPAQYRLWANMIQVGTHRKYDTPPNVPMFGISGKTAPAKGNNLSEALSSAAEGLMRVWKNPSECSCSSSTPPRPSTPASCATVRSQYIQQLKELHHLYEIGAISLAEYEQQKDVTLKKMNES